MNKLLRCYICGESLDKWFYLIAFKNQTTDRVFLVCNKDSCIKRVDTTQAVIPVLRKK